MHGFSLAILIATVSMVTLTTMLVRLTMRKRRRPERACPRCDYDMGQTEGLRCPECGHVAPSARWLRDPQFGRTWVRTLLLSVVLFIVAASPIGQHASLRLVIWVFAPDGTLDAMTGLRVPTAPFNYRGSRYEQLVWDRQVAQTYADWIGLAATTDGSLASLEMLVPAAIQAQEWYQAAGVTSAQNSWYTHRLLDRVHGELDERDARAPVPAGTWAWSVLRYDVGDPTMYPLHRNPPRVVMETLAGSASGAVRTFVLDEIAALRVPWAHDLVKQFRTDPDPAIRTRAEQIAEWRDVFVDRPS